MKIYISADIEGVTGTVHWNETEKDLSDFNDFADQMTNEVIAACQGAMAAGAEDIWIKDAHDSARNIDIKKLPKNTKLIRGWSRHPFCMMQELDESFDAAIMTGYHSAGSLGGNPLSHTLNNSKVNYIKINGEIASEFIINAYTAALIGVPVVFVSGDEELCEIVRGTSQNIKTTAVKKGVGNSVISIHPELANEKIKTGVEEALRGDYKKCLIKLPENFKVEIGYLNHKYAYAASFYPGARLSNTTTVEFKADNYFDVLRMFMFLA
ncbi:M55 family metallopeptidase [Clostridium swellfunianum]|uniref:M55 family metallopeptidase n=1 Tax=Clostridium swellfunianum TaxID=1367462 RepID=UPI00202FB821|nr:M55 family metallopeptidase [Clostridium swellfunianum]MCM0649251.1 M55 family metallopeptidase [Clostridium swellfunianum]